MVRWHVVSRVFSLSSNFDILSTRSAITSSRCIIYVCWEALTSIYSTMSVCSWVIALSSSFYISIYVLFLSSWSSLTKVCSSYICSTRFSKLFPAVCTVLMEASASSFHFLSVFCSYSRPPTYVACVLRFWTTSEQNCWTSSNC